MSVREECAQCGRRPKRSRVAVRTLVLVAASLDVARGEALLLALTDLIRRLLCF
jgi:hypothetical protein